MSSFQNGSICLDDLFAASKALNPAITTGKNGKKYASITIWHNDEVDKFGNDGSIQLNSKDKADRVYIGNIRNNKPKEETKNSVPSSDDIPF